MPAQTRHRSKQAVASTNPASQTNPSKTSAVRSTVPAASTRQLVNLDQSTELVQTLLHTGISCVAFLRQIFPDKCFMRRKYENRPDHWSYDDWVAGKKGHESPSERAGSAVSLLERGTDESVNRLLDWLEKGVFDALKKRYLDTFQLHIVENESRPFEVIETYDFKIRYTEPTGAALVAIRMPDKKPASIWNVRLGVTQVIQNLTSLCQTFAELPRQRSLKMQLTYNDTCPSDYEPPGFKAGASDTITFPSGEGWARKTHPVGEMKTGYHGLTLRVNHLEQSDPSAEGSEIPANLPYTDLRSILEDADRESLDQNAEKYTSADRVDRPNTMPDVSKEASKSGSLGKSPKGGPRVRTSGFSGVAGESAGPPTNLGKVDSSQTQNETRVGSSSTIDHEYPDISDRDYLRNALEDTPMDDSYPDTQPIRPSIEENGLNTTSAKQEVVLQLSEEKLSAIMRAKERGELSSLVKRRRTGLDLEGLGSADVINCECDWNGEDPEQMLQCQLCENWQHSYCYGYLGRSDKRIPKKRFCYSCLKAGEDPKMFSVLQELALKRCGIRHIERFGFVDVPKFAQGIGIDRQTASRLSGYLRERQYLIPVSGQKDQLKATHRIVESGPAHDRMMTECFEPFKHIEHLYVSHNTASSISAVESIQATRSASEKTKTLAKGARPSQTSVKTHALHKGKQQATTTAPEQVAPSITQTPRRKRRTQEDWIEEVGRRVTPKRACKTSVSNGFVSASYSYPTSPGGTSASANDDEMEL
ncbi:HORMA domain-containing protein [Phyllosticta citricarpa]|uniref:HORMA domain-containing protein n=2 Tax=Phyllosticta TaxID=121621 RepID=A0ABR1LSU6_9PEZI